MNIFEAALDSAFQRDVGSGLVDAVNRGILDHASGARYDAQMPMRTVDGKLEAVSVVPRGLKKNKAPKR